MTDGPPHDQTPATPTREGSIERAVDLFVHDLAAAVTHARIYWPDHPRVRETLATALVAMHETLAHSTEPSLLLSVADGYLVFRQRALLGATMTAARLIEGLTTLGSGGLEMTEQADTAALGALVEQLLAKRAPAGDGDLEPYEVVNRQLAARGAQGVELLPPYRVDGDDHESPVELPMQMYQSVMEMLESVTITVCQGGSIRFDEVRATAETMLRQLVDDDEPLLNLARHEQYDAFTFGHSVRVSVLALNFGRALTDDESALLRLGTAALMHDVGKSLVPFDILHSRRALDAEEREIIRRHAELGAHILVDHDAADSGAVAAAFGHHTSCGGQSYPKTLHEHRTSTLTEIIKICDVYEALTAARPYKRPMTPLRAYRIMLANPDHFDRGLLKRFVHVNGLYPAGQLVELSSGEIAEVAGQSDDLHHPMVRLLTDASGNVLDPDDQVTADLRRLSVDGDQRAVRQAFDRVELEAVTRALRREQARRRRKSARPSTRDLELARATLEREETAAQEMITHGDACSHRELIEPIEPEGGWEDEWYD